MPFFGKIALPVLLTFLFLFGACSRKPKGEGHPEAPAVQVYPVIERDVPLVREWIGTLEGAINAEIRAQAAGYITSQHYQEGSFVKRGDLLFGIDPRPNRAAYEQALAALARARAVQLKADQDERRGRQLFDRQVISAQERDQYVEAAGAALADTLAQEAVVETARINLGFTRIFAPIDGVAGLATAQVGDLVGPASTTPLTTVSMIDPIKAVVTVTEQGFIQEMRDFLAHQTPESDVPMELLLADGTVFPHGGRFYALDRQVDPRTGALRFAILFSNPERILRPGLFCRVRAKIRIRKGALLIPQRAVIELQGSNQVAVVGPDGRATVRNVTLGEQIGSLWLVKAGLKPRESVVVEGVQKIREGKLVDAKPWRPPPGYLAPPREEFPAGPLPTMPPGALVPTVK